MLGVSLHPFVSCIISLQSKFKHVPVLQLRQCHRKQFIPLRDQKDRVKNAQFLSLTQAEPSRPMKVKDYKIGRCFSLILALSSGTMSILRRLYPKNTSSSWLFECFEKIPLFRGVFCWISFSGSLLQIFQIFQLPLRTTKLVNG